MVTLTVDEFGVHKGRTVKKFTWRTPSGFSLSAISYGVIIQSVKVPDRNGVTKDVALGFDDIDSYVTKNRPDLFGAVCGRCVNRIGNASFEIDGEKYQLTKNFKEHHLHGGLAGFDTVIWDPTVVSNKVIFSYLSKDGEEHYPGDLLTNITYEVLDDNSLNVEYIATTTKKTVVNLTNHSYWNLAGHDSGAKGLYDHVVTLNADRYLEPDEDFVPTGRIRKVMASVYDLRTPTRLGDVLVNDLFHDNFIISNYREGDMNFIARVVHPVSGRYLEVYSDQPAVTFYTGGFLPSNEKPPLIGKESVGYRRHGGLCIEDQKHTNAINHKNFPSTILTPGEVYKHKMFYRFGVDKSEELPAASK